MEIGIGKLDDGAVAKQHTVTAKRVNIQAYCIFVMLVYSVIHLYAPAYNQTFKLYRINLDAFDCVSVHGIP